jgi:glycosyltransferase involved in cell wall biosynthesis
MSVVKGRSPRVALCHEWLTTYGGSEQVAQRLAHVLDATDVFTFTARPELAAELFPGRRVHVSRWGTGSAREHWQRYLPVMPWAWSMLDLGGFDLVVTSSHACANAIRVPPGTLHVSYCHTPMRYAWRWREELGRVPPLARPAWPAAAAALRRADRSWARRVDLFIANSRHVADRIKGAYGRDALVVHPPVDTDFWTPSEDGRRDDYFLVAGRLVAYKRADVAVRAAGMARVRLVVAGDGPELPRFERMATPGVEFVRNPSRDELRELYRRARALVVPGVEDFGMTMIEAQACGTPVVARRAGGAVEAVLDGRTGLLYDGAWPEALAAALRRFDHDGCNESAVRGHARRFDVAEFDAAIATLLERVQSDEWRGERPVVGEAA